MSSFLKKALVISAISFAPVAFAADMTGAGATFPYPIYAKWAEAYKAKTGSNLNYQSIGSSGGIKQIKAKTVDFGATDNPVKFEDLEKDGMVQFPAIIGGVVPVMNVDGVKPGELKLDGPTLADIFQGVISDWGDKRIAIMNPGVKIPSGPITVVVRADGSGTTAIFTDYLAKTSTLFKDAVGAGASVKWPAASTVGGKGNEGVAANVLRVKNSIGYVEYAYAKQNGLAHTTINGIQPNKATFQTGWPITAPTYIIMHRKAVNLNDSKEALKFFEWAYKNGDKMADELDYVPLSDVQKKFSADLWKYIE